MRFGTAVLIGVAVTSLSVRAEEVVCSAEHDDAAVSAALIVERAPAIPGSPDVNIAISTIADSRLELGARVFSDAGIERRELYSGWLNGESSLQLTFTQDQLGMLSGSAGRVMIEVRAESGGLSRYTALEIVFIRHNGEVLVFGDEEIEALRRREAADLSPQEERALGVTDPLEGRPRKSPVFVEFSPVLDAPGALNADEGEPDSEHEDLFE